MGANIRLCKNCNQPLTKKNQKIFCSISCAAKVNNVGVRRNRKPRNQCKNCGNECKYSYCSNSCQGILKMKEIEESYFKGESIPSATPLKKIILRRDGHCCSICKTTDWFGNVVPLVLDHIDGNATNNLPENLRLVCGNCDMLLPTYKSKNRGNGRHSRKERYQNGKSY